MDNDTHKHLISRDPETGEEEWAYSHEDGSCSHCRMTAEDSGRCGNCYGQGSFTTEDSWFDCHACCGTGDAMTKEQRDAFKAKGYEPRSLSFNDYGDADDY